MAGEWLANIGCITQRISVEIKRKITASCASRLEEWVGGGLGGGWLRKSEVPRGMGGGNVK